MKTIVAVLVGAIAAHGVVLGALGLFNALLNYAQAGVEAQQIPREVFKVAIYALFFFFGIKGLRLSARNMSS